jgi:hypothetical protein
MAFDAQSFSARRLATPPPTPPPTGGETQQRRGTLYIPPPVGGGVGGGVAKRLFLLSVSLYILAIIFNGCTTSNNSSNADQKLWYEALPACPCENPDRSGVKLNDGWAKDKGDIAVYHPDANECFRSYPHTPTREGDSGQQCCYDHEGKLITCGAAAGTPDKESTCSGEDKEGVMTVRYGGVLGHLQKDVNPWKKMGGQNGGWKEYNLLWLPDNRNECDSNCVGQ